MIGIWAHQHYSANAIENMAGKPPTLLIIMNNSIKLVLALLGIAAMALSSCNTVAGVGRDVQSAGAAIHDSAQR